MLPSQSSRGSSTALARAVDGRAPTTSGACSSYLERPTRQRGPARALRGRPVCRRSAVSEARTPCHLHPTRSSCSSRCDEFNWAKVEPAIFGGAAPGRARQGAAMARSARTTRRGRHPQGRPADDRRAVARADRGLPDARRRAGGAERPHALRRARPGLRVGNFLYVAYRELRRIEAELRRRETDMRRSAGLREQQTLALYFPLSNMQRDRDRPVRRPARARDALDGPEAGGRRARTRPEQVLPLVDLSGIRRARRAHDRVAAGDAIIAQPAVHRDEVDEIEALR